MAKSIAFHTLGCKVNQYDTQAMLEAFERAGYTVGDFSQENDIYLINTCTVTGVGDNKSMKLIRRIRREHPASDIIVCGCLAQRDARRVSLDGVRLVIGVKRRAEVVSLYEKAIREDICLNAVDDGAPWTFEALTVTRHEGKTRAAMKIQEGCDRYCAYCVIPYVRGPVRSMALEDVRQEAARLAQAGYKELVVTGIHLASYGRGAGHTLIDAIRAICEPEDVKRVRLGSLEPVVVTEEFAKALRDTGKVMPQFHLSLQSGSKTVLKRMLRRYTPEEYLASLDILRGAFPDCAATTDVLTGFPGETEEEAAETYAFAERANFSRIHVFPYSRRTGTAADRMQNHLPEAVKQARARELIALGNRLEERFVQRLIGTEQQVLIETSAEGDYMEGYSGQYVKVRVVGAEQGGIYRVRLDSREGTCAFGTILERED
ncbi:MAG: tRNA (N(6)-L-threonylcarbamoyladenosine(37)-C(2))-methylthiotransferase MtaB [Christensenellales bacterium]|jgi:threonylcarbamoyladenosine tRNA methylthiotransferase MtaB